jgi:hypothetical protein
VLAKNLGRSGAVPLYEIARDVLDKLIIFHRPLNATAATAPAMRGGNEVNWRYCDYRGRFWFRFPKITRDRRVHRIKGCLPLVLVSRIQAVLRANLTES